MYRNYALNITTGKKKQSGGVSEIDFDEIEATLIGEMGFTPDEIGWFTLREVYLAMQGHTKKVQREWEIARWINFYSISPHVKRGSLLKLTDIALFDWEKGTSETKVKSKEEIQKLVKRWQKRQ